jgi:hypothetical protein
VNRGKIFAPIMTVLAKDVKAHEAVVSKVLTHFVQNEFHGA